MQQNTTPIKPTGWTPRTVVLVAVFMTIPAIAVSIFVASQALRGRKIGGDELSFAGLFVYTAYAWWKVAICSVRAGFVAPLSLQEQMIAACLVTSATVFYSAVAFSPVTYTFLLLWFGYTVMAWKKVWEKWQAQRR